MKLMAVSVCFLCAFLLLLCFACSFISVRACGRFTDRQLCLRLKEELRQFISEENCAPIMVRLAWHDSGTFDASVRSWPGCGGANGSIRFDEELGHGANAGLRKAITFLKEFKASYPTVSWADLIQLASAVAIECTGGPRIPLRVGRTDTSAGEQCPKEGNLPDAKPPFGDGSPDAPSHVRAVFYRMGFDDADIVALMGAHTLGRAFAERSGVTEHNQQAGGCTMFTDKIACPRADGMKVTPTPPTLPPTTCPLSTKNAAPLPPFQVPGCNHASCHRVSACPAVNLGASIGSALTMSISSILSAVRSQGFSGCLPTQPCMRIPLSASISSGMLVTRPLSLATTQQCTPG